MSRLAALAAGLLLGCPPPAAAQRSVEYVLRSPELPAATVRVSPALTYLGRLEYPVGDVARAEEFIFADTAGGKLRRVFIAHFEHFLPETERSFNYPRLRMARLGEHEYLHQTWALARFGLFEIPAVRAFLEARGLSAEEGWLVDRYVRAVDEARRHEVIFFYLEAASQHDPGIRYGGAPVAPPPPPAPPPAIERALHERAREAFQVSGPER